MALDVGLAHRRKRGRLAARRLVLVDNHCSYPRVGVMPAHAAGDYAEFGAHALVEIEFPAASKLRQRKLETQWRLCAEQGRGGLREGCIRAVSDGLRVERREDVLDPVGVEQAIDGGPLRHDAALASR